MIHARNVYICVCITCHVPMVCVLCMSMLITLLIYKTDEPNWSRGTKATNGNNREYDSTC